MISFKGRHHCREIILMSIRWYLAYALSYCDIEEMMAERGIQVDHATVNRWVVKYAPLLEARFTKKHKKPIHSSWRMDETYIKVKGAKQLLNYLNKIMEFSNMASGNSTVRLKVGCFNSLFEVMY